MEEKAKRSAKPQNHATCVVAAASARTSLAREPEDPTTRSANVSPRGIAHFGSKKGIIMPYSPAPYVT